jgi:hypothetical protein
LNISEQGVSALFHGTEPRLGKAGVAGGGMQLLGLAAFDYAQGAREVFSKTLNIGKGQIVYNCELEGINQAFEYAVRVALSL